MAAGADGDTGFHRIFDAQQADHHRGDDAAQDTGEQHSYNRDRRDAAVRLRYADGDGCGSGRTDAGGFSFLPKVLYFGIDGRRGKGLIFLDNNIRKGCNV